jgi:hypothetical protein
MHELKKLELTVHGTFTYGLSGETREQILDTRRFLESLPLDSMQESGTAEVKGTSQAALRRSRRPATCTGARLGGYRREVDSNLKFQRLVEELRD